MAGILNVVISKIASSVVLQFGEKCDVLFGYILFTRYDYARTHTHTHTHTHTDVQTQTHTPTQGPKYIITQPPLSIISCGILDT